MLKVRSASVLKNFTFKNTAAHAPLSDTVYLIKDVSFELTSGNVLSVVGPNGAGKTTLINSLVGEAPLHSGCIEFNSRSMPQWLAQTRAKHVSVLPQISTLNFPFSVQQVVALGRTPHSTGSDIDAKVVCEAMEALDITALAHRIYTELSGGEKQRTQLARVMAQIWRSEDASSRLLILDEPTSALDLGHKQLLMKTIKRFSRAGAAVIMVEHDLNIALRFSDRVLVLNKGEQVAFGAPEKVITSHIIADVFSAQAHILACEETGKPFISL